MRRLHGVVSLLFLAATAGFIGTFTYAVEGQSGPTEAPAAFDNLTNGFMTQAEFDAALLKFVEQEGIDEGLGPVYNAQSCGECHQNPVTGAISQISELRAGHQNIFGNFIDAPGGSLINDRATDANIQERVPGAENVRTLRMSNNTVGDGFVEAINSNTLVAIANAQPGQSGGRIAGQFIQVPVLEANGAVRGGRFGWKNQHASLLSFSSDAYLNEMGITNRLNPRETVPITSGTRPICDDVSDNQPCTSDPTKNCAEDKDGDIEIFARFMRATKAPNRDARLAATADATAGSTIFTNIGCAICHVRNITT